MIYSSAGMHKHLVICNNDLRELEVGCLSILKTIFLELVHSENKEVIKMTEIIPAHETAEEVSDLAEEQSAKVEEISASAYELENMAKNMQSLIKKFEV